MTVTFLILAFLATTFIAATWRNMYREEKKQKLFYKWLGESIGYKVILRNEIDKLERRGVTGLNFSRNYEAHGTNEEFYMDCLKHLYFIETTIGKDATTELKD